MNSTFSPLTKKLTEPCLVKAALQPTGISLKAALQADEPAGFVSLDGNMITYHAGSSAVSSGSGIFIGDYFVGITENYEAVSTTPYVRY